MYRVLRYPDEESSHETLEEANEFAKNNAPSIVFDDDLPLHGYASFDDREEASLVHAYPIQNLLRPANSLNPYSLSHVFLEIGHELAETWLDTKFSDYVSFPEFITQLKQNAHEEIDIAIEKLMEEF